MPDSKSHQGPLYLLAMDGSPSSERALEFAIARSKEAGARLIVAMAVDRALIGAPSSGGSADIDVEAQFERAAQELVNVAASRARKAHVDAVGKVIDAWEGHDVARAVVSFAQEEGVENIFVGSHGKTGIVAVLLGSTAENIVKRAHCHVSVVR